MSSAGSSSGGGEQWAWLGLLKWTLNHADGTQDNSNITPMTTEDKAFLEKVMREGIIDEGERMKFILKEASSAMEYYRQQSLSANTESPPITEEVLEDLLQELRDIVEQIDYARAFCSLQGLPFLLGCIQQAAVPQSIRLASLGILATVGQNNPPVQHSLIELGAIKTLSDLYFGRTEFDYESKSRPVDSSVVKTKIMQSLGAIVRNHELAESVFVNLPQAPELLRSGLDPRENGTNPSISLRSKTLFFLRALVTSDWATPQRICTFQDSISLVRDFYLAAEDSSNNDKTIQPTTPELREMAVELLERLLEDQKGGARLVLEKKDTLAALGVRHISTLRALMGEDRDYAQVELEHWESLMILLARTQPECADGVEIAGEKSLLLTL